MTAIARRPLPARPTGDLLIRHASIVDPDTRTVLSDQRITIMAGIVEAIEVDDSRELSTSELGTSELDASGLFAVPGLIDCHVHLTATSADEFAITGLSPSFVALDAAREMEATIARGFTTVRDAGGADYGYAEAVATGRASGPRVLHCGHALSATGGHGDLRPRGRLAAEDEYGSPGIGLVVDGVDAVRKAVRHEIRRGASHIKLMLSGGVSSPTDSIESLQFSDDEVLAAVDEAARAGIYCSAHAYTAESILRAIRLGIRTIEHGNLLDADAAAAIAAAGAFLVPTLITYAVLETEGAAEGLPPASVAKVASVRESGEASVAIAAEAGVQIAFGSDLLGGMRRHQSEEFAILAGLQDSWEVLRSATTVGAALLGYSGILGTIAVGAAADILLLTDNPGLDARVLSRVEHSLELVIAGGLVVAGRRATIPGSSSLGIHS